MNKITIEAPAKINLTLDIKGKRDDGYHEIETVMHQISLVDRITLEKADKITLDSDSSLIPHDESNLAFKAAMLILNRTSQRAGVNIFLEKNIPVAAGLAGGSTDAAAVLLGINELYDFNLSYEDLWKIAVSLGSDVPFCLNRTSAIARGRGELLTPLKDVKPLDFLLVKPDFQVSTKEVYQAFDLGKVKRFPDLNAFIKAWQEYDIINISNQIVNVLETVCLEKYPQISYIKSKMIEMGALTAVMSGSGPTVFGVFNNQSKLDNAYNYFSKKYNEVFQVSSYSKF